MDRVGPQRHRKKIHIIVQLMINFMIEDVLCTVTINGFVYFHHDVNTKTDSWRTALRLATYKQ